MAFIFSLSDWKSYSALEQSRMIHLLFPENLATWCLLLHKGSVSASNAFSGSEHIRSQRLTNTAWPTQPKISHLHVQVKPRTRVPTDHDVSSSWINHLDLLNLMCQMWSQDQFSPLGLSSCQKNLDGSCMT